VVGDAGFYLYTCRFKSVLESYMYIIVYMFKLLTVMWNDCLLFLFGLDSATMVGFLIGRFWWGLMVGGQISDSGQYDGVGGSKKTIEVLGV